MIEIKNALKGLVSSDQMATIQCEVIAVNEGTNTCDCRPVNGSAEYLDVQLTSVASSSQIGVILYPKVGTIAIITRVADSESQMYLLKANEIDKVVIEVAGGFKLKVEENKLNIDAEEITFNGGSLGGLVKIQTLTAELNKIKVILEAIKVVLATPVPEAGLGTPSSFQAALNAALSSLLTPDFSQIEDTKIKH